MHILSTQLPLFPDESGPIQESTHQVPCGPYSIFEAEEPVPEFERAVYLVINRSSNWETGRSHSLSYRTLANQLDVKHRSQVMRAVRNLINKGWHYLKKKSRNSGFGKFCVVIPENSSDGSVVIGIKPP